MADSVEKLAVDLRTRVKGLGVREKTRRKKCTVRFSLIKKNKAFWKNYMKVGVKKFLRAGMVPARTWRVPAAGMVPARKIKIEEADGSSSGQKEYNIAPYSWKPLALKWKKSQLSTMATQTANGTQNKKKLA